MKTTEERLDILTKEQEPTGRTALKSEVHQNGYYHNTAHVWLYTKEGSVLLAQRAAGKLICPLLWDVSAAGHVDAGETVEQAAIREVQEELGLTLQENDLQKIGVFDCFQSYSNGMIDNEFHHTYISELRVHIDQLSPNLNEVARVKLVSIKTFKALLSSSKDNNHFVPSNVSYYEVVLKSIMLTLSL